MAQCAAKWIAAKENPKFYQPWGDYFNDCKKKLAEAASAPKAEEAKPEPMPEMKTAEPPKPEPAPVAAPEPKPAPARPRRLLLLRPRPPRIPQNTGSISPRSRLRTSLLRTEGGSARAACGRDLLASRRISA